MWPSQKTQTLNELNLFPERNFLIKMFLKSGAFSSYEKENKTISKHCFDFFSKTFSNIFFLLWYFVTKIVPTARKKYSGDQEKLLQFKAESQEFAKFLISLEQFIQIVKGQNNFW